MLNVVTCDFSKQILKYLRIHNIFIESPKNEIQGNLKSHGNNLQKL